MTIFPGALVVEQGGLDSVQVNAGFVTWSAGPVPAGVTLLGAGGAPSTEPNWEPDFNGIIRVLVASDAPPDTATIFVDGQDNDGYGAGASFFLEVVLATPTQAR